jgi:hypothetical protein
MVQQQQQQQHLPHQQRGRRFYLLLSGSVLFFMAITLYHGLARPALTRWYEEAARRRGRAAMPTLVRATHLFDQHGVKYIVHAGTLLHLYRNGTLLEDESDLDIAVPLELVPRARDVLVASGEFEVEREFGHAFQPGHEYHFNAGDIRLDVFSINDQDSQESWTPLWVGWQLRKCFLNSTVSGERRLTISTGQHNHTFSVPDNVDACLTSMYGEHWATPIESSEWYWVNENCR